MEYYHANIHKVTVKGDEGSREDLVQGRFETFKELELALERGLKASVIPRKKKSAPKKAPAKKKAKK